MFPGWSRARSLLGCHVALVTLTAALLVAGPRPPSEPARPSAWLAGAQPDSAVLGLAGLAAWACVVWLAFALLVSALSAAPGVLGRLARVVAPRIVPAAMRGALGLTIAALPAAATLPSSAWADNGRPSPAWLPPSLDRPATSTPVRVSAAHHASYVVRPGDCLWSIARDHLGVHPSHAAVAARWPQWYAANERVIGVDPDLIRPGQRLT